LAPVTLALWLPLFDWFELSVCEAAPTTWVVVAPFSVEVTAPPFDWPLPIVASASSPVTVDEELLPGEGGLEAIVAGGGGANRAVILVGDVGVVDRRRIDAAAPTLDHVARGSLRGEILRTRELPRSAFAIIVREGGGRESRGAQGGGQRKAGKRGAQVSGCAPHDGIAGHVLILGHWEEAGDRSRITNLTETSSSRQWPYLAITCQRSPFLLT